MYFEMLIELDEERMQRDGLDPAEHWAIINDIVEDCPEADQEKKGFITTDDYGIRMWICSRLQKLPWFMKYVSKWEYADPTMREDLIESLNEIGVKCCYE